jgi:hypothetical protein
MIDSDPLVVERRSWTPSWRAWSPWSPVLNGRIIGDSLRVFLDPDGDGVIEVREGESLMQYRFGRRTDDD